MARQDFRFQRGDHVRDLITGFSGVVISRADSITGCDRFCVQPQDLDNGKMIDSVWIDDHCLEYDPRYVGQKVDLHARDNQPPG
jgi:hypothetical protein